MTSEQESPKPTLASVGRQCLAGPWENPDELTPIPRRAMYALAVAAHRLTGAMTQRTDSAYMTVRDVRNALGWLDEFAAHLKDSWPRQQEPVTGAKEEGV